MSRLNDPENFAGRCDYAAKVISQGMTQTRAFSNCFENDDGDAVAAAMVRRAEKNLNLAKNLPRYLEMTLAQECAERLKGKNLPDEARAMRAKARAAFDAWMAEQDAKRAATA